MAINNKLLEQFFTPIGQKKPEASYKKGTLITFSYNFWKHDPQPLLIISPPPKKNTITPGVGKLWGVNLHYLTFFSIKKLIKECASPFFSYSNIKMDDLFGNAYRSYHWSGIRAGSIRFLNKDAILNIMGSARSQDPADADIVRKNVQEQISKQINPKSYEVNLKTLNKEDTSQLGTIPTIKNVPIVQNKME